MTPRIKFVLACVCALASLAWTGHNASAAEISGIKLPDQVTLEGKTLKLNGTGLRQAKIILTFNVYAAGLYLETPSHDESEIANSAQLKSIEMVFMRNTSGKEMGEALQEGFQKNCTANPARLESEVEKVRGLLKDIKKGETMAYHFLPDRVEVMIRGKKAGTIESSLFSREFILCWIGANPPNAGLKEGLLGGKK